MEGEIPALAWEILYMRVVSVPGRLRLATVMIVLCVPLVALQTVLYYRAPWWNLPYGRMTLASAVALAVFLPLGGFVARGYLSAWRLAAAVSTFWLGATIWIAVGDRNFWLGVFVVALAVFWIAILTWIRMETSRSFFDPRMA